MIRRKGEEGSGFIGKGQDNVYAGKDGNVYRRDENGNWSKWDNGSWNSVQKPDNVQPIRERMRDQSGASQRQVDRSTFEKLQRDSARRSEGARRTSDFGSYRSRGGGNVGSYRGYSGGGFRGGGFRGGGRRR
jgi:hypothetical protein